jgi:hypothetical protein
MEADMNAIPDFTGVEQQLVTFLLHKRYGTPVALQVADSELQADPIRRISSRATFLARAADYFC